MPLGTSFVTFHPLHVDVEVELVYLRILQPSFLSLRILTARGMAEAVGSSSLSKNQKKRARKKAKKESAAVDGEGTKGAVAVAVGSEGAEEKEKASREEAMAEKEVVKDPVAEIKRRIQEAKANKDHDTAQKLREQLWILQDTSTLGETRPEGPQLDHSLLQDLMKPQTVPQASSADPIEKRLSRLKKKLKQIEALKERQAKGENLESNQLAKIDTEQALLDEIAEFEEVIRSTELT